MSKQYQISNIQNETLSNGGALLGYSFAAHLTFDIV
jgi:hypothetical protein